MATKTERDEKKRGERLERMRARTDTVRDIGPPPAIVDQDRRSRCEYDFKQFCLTYFEPMFRLKFSADHEMMIQEIQRVSLEGGKVCVAMPRGS